METENVNGTIKVDANTITTSQNPIEAGVLSFSLESVKKVTWWKGLKIYDSENNMISLLSTTDQDHGPDTSKKFNAGDFDDTIKVEIWKAKGFGAHCCMKTALFKMTDCVGQNTLLLWKDE